MATVARPPVITEDVGQIAFVETRQDFNEFLERHPSNVTRITIPANPLVRRVHIDDIARDGESEDFAVVG